RGMGIMRYQLSAVLLMSLLVGTSAASALQQNSKNNVTGKWLFQVETSAGSGTPTVTLKQDDEKLTGHYSSTNLGEAELNGTVKGGTIQFSFVANVQDLQIDVAYSGTVETNDAMKGTVTLGGVGQGTFTAKRQ
ncbi:MAG TPA: hypothetical protein VH701_26925, partial [Vicinamibacterales bacterium]